MGIFKAILGICETKQLDDRLWALEDGSIRIKLGQVSQLSAEGGAVYLKGKGLEKPVLVVRVEGNKYLAFENKCTHGGRKIDNMAGEHKLKCCSISHSTFDYDGNVLSGPASGPLAKYDVEMDGEELIVKLPS